MCICVHAHTPIVTCDSKAIADCQMRFLESYYVNISACTHVNPMRVSIRVSMHTSSLCVIPSANTREAAVRWWKVSFAVYVVYVYIKIWNPGTCCFHSGCVLGTGCWKCRSLRARLFHEWEMRCLLPPGCQRCSSPPAVFSTFRKRVLNL